MIHVLNASGASLLLAFKSWSDLHFLTDCEQMSQINEELRRYLASLAGHDRFSSMTDDDSLLESGIIDSAAMIDLVAHLETTYSISIDEDDMMPENFDTIDGIVQYVQSKQDAQSNQA